MLPPYPARMDEGTPPLGRLTPKEGFYLARYLTGRLVADRVSTVFLVKWLFALAALYLLAVGGRTWMGSNRGFGAFALAVFLLLWAAQHALTWSIRRLAVPRRYRPAFDSLEAVRGGWWPRLRAELIRVGLPGSRLGAAGVLRRYATRRLRPGEREALAALDLRRVFGDEPLRRARELFAGS